MGSSSQPQRAPSFKAADRGRYPLACWDDDTHRETYMRGLDPVHRLKARENAAGSENPTR